MGILFNLFPLLLLTTWGMCVIQSYRMVYLFKTRYPEVARKEITNTFFQPFADSAQFFYFFNKKNVPFLKKDPELWKLRQQVKVLSILSVGLPILFPCFFVLLAMI